MPSPRDFALYDKVLPGTAKVIRDQFELNGEHLRKMQASAMSFQKDDGDRNRRVAERLVWGAFVLILVLALRGHSGVAIAVAVTTVAAVLAGFLKSHRQKSDSTVDHRPPTEGQAEQVPASRNQPPDSV